MSKVKFRFSLDIEGALRETIEEIQLDGIGADNNSNYEVTDVSLDDEGGYTYTCEIELDRTQGKFVSNDDLEAEITGNLGSFEVTIDYV
jgi:hypothetical protein